MTRTLVLLHPIGLDGQTWQFVEPDAIGSAVAHEFPGHGKRAADTVPDLTAFADDLLGRVPGLLDLVGVSMGGAVALHAALRAPGRIASVALVAAGAGSSDGSALDRRAEAVERGGVEAVLDETIARWFGDTHQSGVGVAYARRTLLTQSPQWFAACWRALARHDVTARLGTIRVPVTVVHPQADAAPVESKEAMVQGLPQARLVVVDAPHMVQLARPTTFAAAIRDHLVWAQADSRGT